MAKEKNKRENHITKRGTYGHGYGPKSETQERGKKRQSDRREERPSDRKTERKTDRGYEKSFERRPERFAAERLTSGRSMQGANDFMGAEANPNLIVGRNPVMEALKSGREIDKLVVCSEQGSMIKILALAKESGIPVMKVEKIALDRIAPNQAHQGVCAYTSPYKYAELDDIFKKAAEKNEDPFILILDNLEDPHNLGAIMRTAECAGAHGVIIPKRRACGLTEVVAKASAGAIEYMPCVKVTNIAQTIDDLKKQGIWVGACDMGGQEYYQADLKGKIAIVIGSEGFGISKLVKEKCDFVVSMPMVGKITSLNASNAAAIVIYEVRKQRDGK